MIFQTGTEAVVLGVELNNYCNRDCLHCLRDLKGVPESFPVDLLGKILREARPYGASLVGFTGGEPTLHPHLEEILRAVTREGYHYYLVTNGARFEKLYPLLLRHRENLAGLSFSVDGATRETHDDLRGEGSFLQVMAAIAACHGEGITFNLQMTLNNRNLHQMKEMALLAGHLGASNLFFAHLMPTPDLVHLDLLPSPAQYRRAEDEMSRLRSLFSFEIHMAVGYSVQNPLFHCRAQTLNALNFDYQGNLTVCCQLSNYRGSEKGQPAPARFKKDLIGSMREMTLSHGIQKLQQTLADLFREKIQRIQTGSFGGLDHFPCFFCARYFQKIPWLGTAATPWSSAGADLDPVPHSLPHWTHGSDPLTAGLREALP